MIKLTRRTALKSIASGIGLGATPLAGFSKPVGRPSINRVVFFLQNQGFPLAAALPKGMRNGPLDGADLPEDIRPLEPYKNMLHIVAGLHGRHTSPSHSAYFGALGGYRGSAGLPPRAATIDHVVSQALPETILPHLCIGMDSLSNMQVRPTVANLSAKGARKPIFMHSNPVDLYQLIFGGIATGEVRREFEMRSRIYQQVEKMALKEGRGLDGHSRERFDSFTREFGELNEVRDKLADASGALRKYAPALDKRFLQPAFETDWHDALLDIGIAALQSGVTNTLTIGSGRGTIQGAWTGLGIREIGHTLGHMGQHGNDIWIKIRQYNCQMLVKLIEQLDAVPEPGEGGGSMMDHSLIIYTSNNAETHHSGGAMWPFMLLAKPGGVITTNRATWVEERRPINDFYTTLLHAVGQPVDRFNMDGSLAERYASTVGPIESILA